MGGIDHQKMDGLLLLYPHYMDFYQMCKPFGIRIHINKRASQKNGSAAALVMGGGGTGHHWSFAPRWQRGSTHQSRGSHFPPAPGWSGTIKTQAEKVTMERHT